MIRVSRGRMRELCAEGLDVRYGKTLVDIVMKEDGSGVIARFEDGSEVEGDMIIGTDGPRSAVRKSLVGEEKARPTASGLAQHNIVVSYRDAEKARHVRMGDPVTAMAYDPAGIFSFISSKKNSLKRKREKKGKGKQGIG
jgi:flavin-dependent dehydrogenase